MNRVILHIGFGKTGSSSLQSYLSFHTLHENAGKKLLYCCLAQDGHVLHGEELTEAAGKTLLGYVSSVPDVSQIGSHHQARKEIGELVRAGYTPFFSQEDWGRRWADFLHSDFLQRLGCRARVIVYVRPQVEWFNSGWWQWWAWLEQFTKPADVVDAWGFEFILWGKQIRQWSKIPGVDDITVRLHPKNTIEDCLAAVGGFRPRGQGRDLNVSIGPMLIKILRAYPQLRTEHSSDVDLILSEFFGFSGKTPWVIDRQFAARIVENSREDNRYLMDLLDPVSKSLMGEDKRWWSAEAYSDRRVWTEEELTLHPREYEEILGKALGGILAVGRRLGGFRDAPGRAQETPPQASPRLAGSLVKPSWKRWDWYRRKVRALLARRML